MLKGRAQKGHAEATAMTAGHNAKRKGQSTEDKEMIMKRTAAHLIGTKKQSGQSRVGRAEKGKRQARDVARDNREQPQSGASY